MRSTLFFLILIAPFIASLSKFQAQAAPAGKCYSLSFSFFFICFLGKCLCSLKQ